MNQAECLFEQMPPTYWQRQHHHIIETWRVYWADDESLVAYVSPINGEQIDITKAIDDATRKYIGDWPSAKAEVIRWDALRPGQQKYL